MTEREGVSGDGIYRLDASDPEGRLVDRSGMSADDVAQVSEVMQALGALRAAEQRISDASRRYMKLNETDMRALHFLAACLHTDTVATPGAIAAHLGISTASTTKLLDRLETGGHVTRAAHPTDRRALAIAITPETHEAAMQSVGRQHAKRVPSVMRLSPAERETVIEFLRNMAADLDTP
ncbi:MarR family transcriptional regulator [Microbacterium mitrae]|uniref:MarR family transcriptional regulator n=1 Tax=Microbacterium mitrae TaxID=664640 RepID=A0A5C8HLN6_9MICO|nr:MarR family transcriptional regulator [Microbacterium mitrae]TXK04184.1 MarR family transcriptional regulator [Microbacterium mitrae]